MVDWPATAYTRTDLSDASDYPEVAQINTPANEIVAMQPHFGAGTAITSNGGIRLTLKDGGVAIAYTGQKAVDGLDDTPQTIIPDGTGDVAVGAVLAYMVSPSSGSASGGVLTLYNGETEDLYNDGTNQVTISVSAVGAMTVVRAAGSLTYDVGINILINM